jgi:cellulose synthase (UDP-forming)
MRTLRFVVLAGSLLFLCLAALLYLPWQQQLIFASLTLFVALCLNRVSKSYFVTITLILLSVYSTVRYGFWRLSSVVAWFHDPGRHWSALDAFFVCLLLLAECYAFTVLMLGYLQILRPLRRKPAPLPDDPEEWPAIDLLIPTLNEPLSVVRCTALAAINIDWPADKLNVCILDDGRREELRAFAQEAGIGYMTRDNNLHAKAGNLNSALARLNAPFVAVFDCDHVPTRSFLQVSMGWFVRDAKLGMLQTPHRFYSPDPFERNLHQFRAIPNEGDLFYGVIQDGNDFWNSTLFCGSCAVLRRSALDAVGGVAVESVTEDAQTSLRMQKDGWNTAYINIPQAAGLATGSLSAHVRQRIRWARGMVQILRVENPLFAPGLSVAQRLCYFNAMAHFLYALPRLIFLTAPLIYLIFGHTNIPGYWAAILAYAAPHLLLANLAGSRVRGRHRHSFWNEIYETALAPYILLPTLFALINPRFGRFNVTAKSGVVDREYFDTRIAWPFLLLLAVNIFGLLCVVARLHQFPTFYVPAAFSFVNWPASLFDPGHAGTIWVNVIWTLFNVALLSIATAVAWESQQRRQTVRMATAVPSDVIFADGSMIQGITADLSSGGVRATLDFAVGAELGDPISFVFPVLDGTAMLPARVIGVDGTSLRAQFESLSLDQEQALTMVLYSRADTWLVWDEAREPDRPLRSLGRVVRLALRGLVHLVLGPADHSRRSPKTRFATSIAPLLLLGAIAGIAPRHADAAQATAASQPPVTFNDAFTLADTGVPEPIVLRGADATHSVYFSLPRNQIVQTSTLHLRYRFSPGLLPTVSQLKVSLNGTAFATIPVDGGSGDRAQGATQDATLALPADLLVRDNQLTFEFIGHYDFHCEDPINSTLWSQIDPDSAIEMAGSVLPLANDLSSLPLPFYDSAVNPHPVLPIVFLAPPSHKAIQATGIVASWFGVQANSRPIRFPVTTGAIPAGNAIVIAENPQDIPASLSIGATSGPTIAMRANPSDPASKLLVLTGGSADELLQAALALAIHQDKWHGEQVSVSSLTLPDARKPTDAPRWLNTEARVTIGDTTLPGVQSGAQPAELQTDGSSPISVYLRLPPDLNYGQTENLAFHLNYRYNGIPLSDGSSLQVYLNGEYVSSTPLPPTSNTSTTQSTVIPIPVAGLRPFSNTLMFRFVFQPSHPEHCVDAPPPSLQGAILKDSYLDIDHILHYTELPNLELFANSGYPFTRLADLGDTAVVLPDRPTPDELQLFLTLMGHFGAQTGYPALSVSVTGAEGMIADGGKDYLVLGTVSDQPALKVIAGSLPVGVDAGGLHPHNNLSLIGRIQKVWLGMRSAGKGPQQTLEAEQLGTSEGLPDAIIEGGEWPSHTNRSVVAIVLRESAATPGFLSAFLAASQSSAIAQSVSVLHGEKFSSYSIGDHLYRVGEISPLLQVRLTLQDRPWLLAVVTVLYCFLLATVLGSIVRRRAQLRLQDDF